MELKVPLLKISIIEKKFNLFLISGFMLCVALYSAVVIRFPDNFFAEDSYFYFQVASNMAKHMGSTFNGIMLTNGYHPLWLLVCSAIFMLVPIKASAVHVIGLVICLLGAATLFLLARICSQTADGLWWIPFLIYLPFNYLPQIGSESALSGLLVALLVLATYLLAIQPTLQRAFFFSLTGSLAVLARLDNIFIVASIFIAVNFFAPHEVKATIRRYVMYCLPVYLLLWGGYIGSNLYWYGSIQPISGILKSLPNGHGNNIPGFFLFVLAFIVTAIYVLAQCRRDTFFGVVEVPFSLGVVIHALYLSTVMRNGQIEWNWYYTTWILLASILLARVLPLLFAGGPEHPFSLHFSPGMRNALGLLALGGLLLGWYPMSYKKYAHLDPFNVGAGFEENLSGRLHLKSVIVYDLPGRLAFFTDVKVVPLDGLMTNIHFQQELAAKGIAAFDRENNVSAFLGPLQPFDATQASKLCNTIILGSTRFHCVEKTPGVWVTDRVEVFSRLTGTSAGFIDLEPQYLIWNLQDVFAVWLIPPEKSK